jgi:hypothetical protein
MNRQHFKNWTMAAILLGITCTASYAEEAMPTTTSAAPAVEESAAFTRQQFPNGEARECRLEDLTGDWYKHNVKLLIEKAKVDRQNKLFWSEQIAHFDTTEKRMAMATKDTAFIGAELPEVKKLVMNPKNSFTNFTLGKTNVGSVLVLQEGTAEKPMYTNFLCYKAQVNNEILKKDDLMMVLVLPKSSTEIIPQYTLFFSPINLDDASLKLGRDPNSDNNVVTSQVAPPTLQTLKTPQQSIARPNRVKASRYRTMAPLRKAVKPVH